MSDNPAEVTEIKSTDVIVENAQILKLESPAPALDLNDIFINDEDTFECSLKFKKETHKYFLEGSDEYVQSKMPVSMISFTCKYPSVKEFQSILAASKSGGNFSPQDITLMELTRLYALIKKWNLPKNLNEIVNISPVLIKGMLNKVQEKIGLEGII